MTRTMYDATADKAPNIPTSAALVAGYVDGNYAWSASNWARFPNSVKVRIAVFTTTNDGHVLDCEPGNNTPAQSVDWVLMRRKAGVDPTVYCNQLDADVGWPAVRAAFQARKVAEPHYWVANYSAGQGIPSGAVAFQYEDAGAYDLSTVADYWPGVDPASQPNPSEDKMILHSITGSPDVWALSGPLYWHVVDPASLNSYKAAGVPQATITAAEHASILAAVAAQQTQAATVNVTVDSSQLAAALGSVLPTTFTGTLGK